MNAAPARPGRREWIGLGVIALPCLLYSMDLTVLNLALPSLSAALHPTGAQLLWIVDIYGFVLAGFLVTMGTLGDRIGRRKLLLIGAAAFGAASVLAAFSRSAPMLIAARAILGVAGATLAPSTLSLIRNMFPDPRYRTSAVGIWVTSYSAGGAIGPLLGGLLLDHFWWGSVFLIGVPVMLLLLAVGPMLLPESRDPGAGRMDLGSAALSLAGVLLVIFGVKRIAQDETGWPAWLTIVSGLVIGCLFVRRQLTLDRPLIDFRLFRARAFSTSLAAYTLGTFVAFGFFLFLGQYLQVVLGLTPFRSGVLMIPIFVAFIVGSLVVPMIARHVTAGTLMGGGLLLAAGGFALIARVGVGTDVTTIVVGCTAYCLALAPVFTLATDQLIGAAPPERAGAAAALSETGSELGGALGIALLGSVGAAFYRAAMVDALPAGVPAAAAAVARATIGGAMAVARQLPAGVGDPLATAARDAFSRAVSLTAYICAALVLVMGGVVLVALRQVGSPVHRAAGHSSAAPEH
jgi:DHA2 family multidrug resistance protein-like MFS transporter